MSTLDATGEARPGRRRRSQPARVPAPRGPWHPVAGVPWPRGRQPPLCFPSPDASTCSGTSGGQSRPWRTRARLACRPPRVSGCLHVSRHAKAKCTGMCLVPVSSPSSPMVKVPQVSHPQCPLASPPTPPGHVHLPPTPTVLLSRDHAGRMFYF